MSREVIPRSVFIPVKSDEHRVNSSRATSSAASDGARRTAAPRAKSGVPAPLHDRARRLAHPYPPPPRPELSAVAGWNIPKLAPPCAASELVCLPSCRSLRYGIYHVNRVVSFSVRCKYCVR